MSRLTRIILAAAIFTSLFYIGCILDPKPDKNPPDVGPQKDFKPLTEKENIVYNLVLSYEKTDITHYKELLHDKYVWHNQERFVVEEGGEDIYTKDKDINMVNNMFQAAMGNPPPGTKPIDKISLTIPVYDDPDKYWSAYTDEIDGEPCDDCWQTTREYILDVIIGETTLHANDNITLIIAPVYVDGEKQYRIIIAQDLEI